MAEKSKVHDGMIFHWSSVAVRENLNTIGFYFDMSGIPQPINGSSVYGSMIKRWEAEDKG